MRIYISLTGFLVLAAAALAGTYTATNQHKINGDVLGITDESHGVIVNSLPVAGDSDTQRPSLDNIYYSSFEDSIIKEEVDVVQDVPAKLVVEHAVDYNEFKVFDSEKAFIIDLESDQELLATNADRVQAIASITKLATALTFVDVNPGWDEYYTIKKEDLVSGGRIYVFEGEEVKIKDLFHLSLIASANSATKALVRATGLTEKEFVEQMNVKMLSLGLKKTNFEDPIGFSYLNVSSAREVAILAKIAFANPDIGRTCVQDSYVFKTRAGRTGKAMSTNMLFNNLDNDNYSIDCGKTGYTAAAGYCFVGKFEQDGKEIITVYLGGENHYSRFQRSQSMAEWTFENYEWIKE